MGGWEGWEGKEARGDLVTEEEAVGGRGEGEKLPYGLGQHGLRCGSKIHEPKAPCPTGQESDVLAREKGMGRRGGLLGAVGGRDKAIDRSLHWGGVKAGVGREKTLLVDHFGGQTLISCMHPTKEARVEG